MQNYDISGLYPAIWEKAPGHNWEKIIDLMSKLGKIIDIKHNYGSKIYPKNQLILHCFEPCTSVFSNILMLISCSTTGLKNIIFFFYILNWEKVHAIGKKGGYFPLGMGPNYGPAGIADKALSF